jgi:hypothetical protein
MEIGDYFDVPPALDPLTRVSECLALVEVIC